MSKEFNIAVIGSGYVGTTTAAVLANCGHSVIAIDIDEQKVEQINKGTSPFFEEGLDSLLTSARKMKTLEATTSYEKLAGTDIVFSCVGTPDNPDGSSNLSYIFSAAKEAVKHIKPGAIFVQKSTVPVGTGEKIEQLFAKNNIDVAYVSNPEFLREGTAITDTLWFDRVVAGGSNKESVNKIIEVYKKLESRRDEVASRAGVPPLDAEQKGSYFTTNRNSAELIKVTSNAFLALKISFANSIAKLADHTDADIVEIMDVVGADKRIGRAFLNAGRGYGGGCLVKDVSGLISSASEYGVDLQIMTEVSNLNSSMPGYIANKTKNLMGSLSNKNIAVLGLSYKAGTSDARKSPGVKLANILAKEGANITAYDPEANGEAKKSLRRDIVVCSSLEEAVKETDAVFITTEWPEFIGYNLSKLKGLMHGKLLVDCKNEFSIEEVKKAGLEYVGVGRNGSKNL